MTEHRKRGVLYLGLAYYNNWYLARALRARGWSATTVTTSHEGAEQFAHGYDHYIDFAAYQYRYPHRVARVLERVLRWYAARLERRPRGVELRGIERWAVLSLTRRLLRTVAGPQRERLQFLLRALDEYDVFHFTGVHNLRYFVYFNPRFFGFEPIGWDVKLLRRLGKRIVYSQTACNDGVSQTAFSAWGPHNTCAICAIRHLADSCSDERNLAWGRLRNSVCDFQVAMGGNRADYNDDPQVHEVPEFWSLDPDFWHPESPSPRRR
jgi:hypothetical protein